MNKYIKKVWVPFAIFIILLAIIFSVFRALTPWAKQYKGEVEQHLSLMLGQPVSIKTMETGWYWFQPVLKLDNVSLSDQTHHKITLNKLFIGIDILSSLWHWSLQPGLFYVDKVNLTIKQTDNGWEVAGFQTNQRMTLDPNTYYLVANWLLAQKKIIIKEVSATVYLQNGMVLPLDNIFLTAKNHYGRYKLKGAARLNQAQPTTVTFLADLEINPGNWKKIFGNVFLSLKNFYPAQWQSFYPQLPLTIEKGAANVDFWIDIEKGKVVNLQSQLSIANWVWTKQNSTVKNTISSFMANLAWQPRKDGWRVTGDHIRLKTPTQVWPENSLLIEYRVSEDFYRIFVEKLLLKPLLQADIAWPDNLKPFLKINPDGNLLYNQIEIRNSQPTYVLTQFDNLHWPLTKEIPGVSHLSGVLYWQPNEGRVEISSQHMALKPRAKLPPIVFKEMNTIVDWKELSHGTRITFERLVIAHPDLVISGEGAWDNPSAPTGGLLRLSGSFSATNAQQWLPYVPAKYIKPKLNTWLKNDIKRIGQLSGEVKVNGLVNDFPFDIYPGEFSINTYLHGVDLIFKEQWPITRNIEGSLQVNKRILEANVINAELLNISAHEINLRVEDLGQKDTMYIHGKVEAPANAALNYVTHSPLNKILSRLQTLSMDGLLNLDLKLEIPLYPENDKLLAKGSVTFNDNNVVVHHPINDIPVTNINGILLFDQDGVTNSALEAVLMGDPVSLHVRSVRNNPQPYTELQILGNTTIEVLKNKFNFPIFSFMQGHLALEGIITLTDDPNDLDHIRINSDLEGVALKLPPPFNKNFTDRTPLSVDVNFNPKKAVHLQFNYNNQLSSNFWVASKKKGYVLKKGEIHFGPGDANLPEEDGIDITGTLPVFDWNKWTKVFASIPEEGPSPLKDKIKTIDVSIHSLLFNQNEINDIAIQAIKKGEASWEVAIQQKAIEGQLLYQGKENSINGSIKHLILENSLVSSSEKNKTFMELSPDKIPNLSLTIDDFVVGKMNLGSVNLESKSTGNRLQIESCKIASPAYSISVKGNWLKEGKINRTDVEATMKIKDLGQTLVRWDISPAIEAEKGQIYFKGGWSGGVNAFALKKLNGDLYLELEDGRITQLSPDTQKKLGMGKLLSILSLQTIPRRLKLDFSDLADSGYSFDELKGNFVVKNGVMHTEDSYIDGPVAYASMVGDLDLVQKLYNVDLRVNPHITASLPVVATIAGGPIAGIATWVASKIINRSMQKISGYTYTVTGPWKDPIVQQVSIFKRES
ncbi:transmembrane protein (plasmid) [Legionella adelaidensis]|uniref:Transmembrane protein n=1 Tax=Legionella adelaidensis TaxID=45056 RepID=A0A0W0R380_9GAMM|nr:YhdP family protein [Legionella adelaidensis]KTC65506.1 transmembrane protein [Legionella adelaidensis]VEH84673.1 transmembrane protein [Legionella adelaidensis]